MVSRQQRVSWAVDDSAVVRDVRELDALLDRLDAEYDSRAPIIAVLDGPRDESVYLGIGGEMSFVSSTEWPYLTTVGDSAVHGEIDYFFEGHHSPILRKQLIPAQVVRRILREFFVSGVLSAWQEWKPVGPE